MSFETYLKQQMLLKTVGVLRTPTRVGLFINNGNTEVSGVGYGRLLCYFKFANAGEPVVMTNWAALNWPVSYKAWGTITHIGVFDNSGTHLLCKKALTTPVVLTANGVPFSIAAHALEIGFV